MSSLRLYQELCRLEKDIYDKCESEYSRKVKLMAPAERERKFGYEAERKQILHDLGYEVEGHRQPVKPLKYHGRAVRMAGFAASQEEARKRRERDEKVQQAHRKLDLALVQAKCVQETMSKSGRMDINK